MDKRSGEIGFVAAIVLSLAAIAPIAHAQDFFPNFFGFFGAHRPQPPPVASLPYAGEESTVVVPENSAPQRRHPDRGESQAYCVRSCDGRYFPISGPNNQSRAALCNGFCPASETNVVYGSSIDNAVTEGGKPYSELPNAFRYRDELVAGCTCNGKDTVGLVAVKLEDDPTLRRGDVVAGEKGLMVAGHSNDRRGASLDLSPAPKSIRSHYRRVPVVAAQ